MNDVSVRDSDIQGQGFFAERDFEQGEKILEVDDTHLVENFSQLTEEEQRWCDFLGEDKTVLMQPPERYINHSCDPNSYLKTFRGIRTLLAMRDITAGEEVTYMSQKT